MKENWIETKLGNICDFVGGGTPSKKRSDFWGGEINWASIKDLKGSYLHNTINKITEQGLKGSSANLAHPDEIILATRINPGRPIYSKITTAINQDLKVVRPKTEVVSKFIFYLLKSNENKIIKISSGTTVLGVSLVNLREVPVFFPPLPIQRAIVAKIEQLFSELDNGIQNLQQAKEKLTVFRQAVLKKAFEGELTKEWRKKNKSSCSEKWSISSFGEICDFKGGGTPSKKNTDYWNGDLPWASIKDIKGDYLVKTQDKITELGYENSSANIAEAGEIIIGTRINPGRPIFSKIRTAINQDLKVVKPKIDLNTTFLFYLFKEKENDILKVSSGTTVLGINLNNLREIEIHIPNSVEEQQQIVQEIESRLSVCDEMEKSIESSLKKAEALRQSILKKAFEGELLTEKEIDQCKQEPDWETAEELLKRIEKEK